MPVPVPRTHKPVAHPVVKHGNHADSQTNPFQNLTRTLPLSPTGPPPSFGTREQWINSLPSWRRTKPRRIWEDDVQSVDHCGEQDFYRGLTAAGNASVIKGAHAEACIPPLYTPLEAGQPPIDISSLGSDDDADDGMNLDYSSMDPSHLDNLSQWSSSSSTRHNGGCMMEGECQHRILSSVGNMLPDLGPFDNQSVPRGTFSPICEDKSPETANDRERDSSPLQPLTPFGEFVDRAITSVHQDHSEIVLTNAAATQDSCLQVCRPQRYPMLSMYPTGAEPVRDSTPAPAPEVVTPSARSGYKKLAEPLADWVANYVWKVCTTGLSLPSVFAKTSNNATLLYSNVPPSYLATSVHSLLLATLLQPSAVFLAIWYIVRLPVYFVAPTLGPEHAKEARFRAALLGDPHSGHEQEAMEASAPFRLIVLGCMLANKWLDDHTFSNRTWHTISNVPIHALNKLESLTLDIFSYDLSVPSYDWSQWLEHVMSYHMALASPTHPQPISRPSSNPHSIIRKAIQEIIQTPAISSSSLCPQPVFLGLEERRKEKIEKDQAMAIDVFEIDLDEDGPLRAEYLPKRRETYHKSNMVLPPTNSLLSNVDLWDGRNMQETEKSLPPPAKWSPAGDEPILRERTGTSGQYVAVQPPIIHNIMAYPPPYYQPMDISYPHWNPSGLYAPLVKSQAAYAYGIPPINDNNPSIYNPYPYAPHITPSHSRSQSLSYDQENLRNRNHPRSYSQVRFEYKCSDIRMTANELAPHQPGDASWMGSGQYAYHGPAFTPIHNLHYQSAWLRI